MCLLSPGCPEHCVTLSRELKTTSFTLFWFSHTQGIKPEHIPFLESIRVSGLAVEHPWLDSYLPDFLQVRHLCQGEELGGGSVAYEDWRAGAELSSHTLVFISRQSVQVVIFMANKYCEEANVGTWGIGR